MLGRRGGNRGRVTRDPRSWLQVALYNFEGEARGTRYRQRDGDPLSLTEYNTEGPGRVGGAEGPRVPPPADRGDEGDVLVEELGSRHSEPRRHPGTLDVV